MSFFTRSIVLIYLLALSKSQLDSPCPNIFEYRSDHFGNLYGYIEVPTPIIVQNKIRLDVQFSVGNAVHGSNGNIELTVGKLNTLDDILKKRNVRYNVNFPPWRNLAPRITQIVVNGKTLCSGPPIPRRLVDVLTTVNLQHTLTVAVPLGYDIYGPFDADNDLSFTKTTTTTTTRSPPATRPNTACGLPHHANSLIVGGRPFPKGAHPWLGALFVQKSEGLNFTCGTTLISTRHTLTAGHCIHTKRKRFRADELWIVLGRKNIQSWSSDGAQIIQAERVHVHPDYKYTTADGDIAVIVLSEDVIYSTLIRPACLWSAEIDVRSIVDQTGVVVGWGRDESGLITSEPRLTSFPVVDDEECLRSNVGFWDITSNRTFCAGYRNKTGPCNGDSGGGFLLEVNGRWTLRGIISMSLATADGSCDLTQYVVFSDVAQFRQWMLSIVNN